MPATSGNRKNLRGYWLTHHFQYRQWDRKISDEELLPVLEELKVNSIENGIVIVPISIRDRDHNTLFIKIKSKVLITCFVSNLSDYRGKNRRDRYYLSHQVIRKS